MPCINTNVLFSNKKMSESCDVIDLKQRGSSRKPQQRYFLFYFGYFACVCNDELNTSNYIHCLNKSFF